MLFNKLSQKFATGSRYRGAGGLTGFVQNITQNCYKFNKLMVGYDGHNSDFDI